MGARKKISADEMSREAVDQQLEFPPGSSSRRVSLHERRTTAPSSAQELRSTEACVSSIEASPPAPCDSFLEEVGSRAVSCDPVVRGGKISNTTTSYERRKQCVPEDGAPTLIHATQDSNGLAIRCSSSSFSSECQYSLEDTNSSFEEQAIQAKLEEAESVGSTFVACPKPMTEVLPPLWTFRLGPYGVGYYYETAGAVKMGPTYAKVVTQRDRPKLGWGRLAYRALVDDDGTAVRTALEKTTSGQEDVASCLASVVKGGSSFYYGDLRVLAGHDDCPLTPEPGDTLLHMAIRHRRSTAFIATLLDLGADRTAVNKAGETPTDLDPLAMGRADEHLRGVKAKS